MGIGSSVGSSVTLSAEREDAPLTEKQLEQIHRYLVEKGALSTRKPILSSGNSRFTAGRPVGLGSDGLISASLLPTITPSMISPQGSGSGLDADTVDGAHYAVGPWVPQLQFGGGNTLMNATASGTYQRFGIFCWITGMILLTAKGTSTGAATIAGLPFPSFTQANMNWLLNARISLGTSFGTTILVAYIGSNISSITLQRDDLDGTPTTITNTQFQDTTQVWVSGFYRTA